MILFRVLLLALVLGLAAACAVPQPEPSGGCPGRMPDQDTDGGLGGTGYGDCPDQQNDRAIPR